MMVIAEQALREMFRRRLFLTIVGGLTILEVFYAFPATTWPDSTHRGLVALIGFGESLPIAIVVLGVALGMMASPGDFEGGTARLFLARPVRRSAYLAGRLIGAAAAAVLVLLWVALVQVGVIVGLGASPPLAPLFAEVGASVTSVITLLLLVTLVSTVTHPIVAGVVGYLYNAVAQTASAALSPDSGASDWLRSLRQVGFVIPHPLHGGLGDELAREVARTYASAGSGAVHFTHMSASGAGDVAVWAAWSVGMFALTVVLFARKDL